ncbi:MAG: MBOAT family protein [Oligoflexales bacterium]|nr:MBOAT family protein [Oligoflexales bacterium]
MLFQSREFFILFVITFGFYLFLPRKPQNVLLLIASYVFYGWWDYKFLYLLIFTTLVDFYTGLGIYGAKSASRKRIFLLISVLINLGVLGLFKYYNFFIESTNEILGIFGIFPKMELLNVILPIGISFYTFKSLCYTIDIYRENIKPCRSLSDFCLYVAFFPQLIAGPIQRADHLIPQIESSRRVSFDQLLSGVILASYGFLKKLAIADNLARIVNPVFSDVAHASVWEIMTATVLFGFQIYADFSGYTDIARGCARILGFNLTINFNSPYFARSPIEFWERWHISLSTWFKDYLYLPLAFHYMRKPGGVLNKYKAHLFSMALIGLWHGAELKFILFGLYWGIWIAIYSSKRRWFNNISSSVAIMINFVIVCFGWLIFRIGNLRDFKYFLYNWKLKGDIFSFDRLFLYCSLTILVMLLIDYIFYKYPNFQMEVQKIDKTILCYFMIMLVTIFGLIVFVSKPLANQDFIYFQF